MHNAACHIVIYIYIYVSVYYGRGLVETGTLFWCDLESLVIFARRSPPNRSMRMLAITFMLQGNVPHVRWKPDTRS